MSGPFLRLGCALCREAMSQGQTFPPSIADIERLAAAAIDSLPDMFRRFLDGVLLRVEDFPSDDVVAEMELESPYDILGLYQGRSVAAEDVTGAMPDMVFLYRRPLLDEWAEGGESLEALVTHVLVHEVGHHFGLSDADMERIEAAAL
jgi:predicted Zn-dependent protease with MMP-like domain